MHTWQQNQDFRSGFFNGVEEEQEDVLELLNIV